MNPVACGGGTAGFGDGLNPIACGVVGDGFFGEAGGHEYGDGLLLPSSSPLLLDGFGEGVNPVACWLGAGVAGDDFFEGAGGHEYGDGLLLPLPSSSSPLLPDGLYVPWPPPPSTEEDFFE